MLVSEGWTVTQCSPLTFGIVTSPHALHDVTQSDQPWWETYHTKNGLVYTARLVPQLAPVVH